MALSEEQEKELAELLDGLHPLGYGNLINALQCPEVWFKKKPKISRSTLALKLGIRADQVKELLANFR